MGSSSRLAHQREAAAGPDAEEVTTALQLEQQHSSGSRRPAVHAGQQELGECGGGCGGHGGVGGHRGWLPEDGDAWGGRELGELSVPGTAALVGGGRRVLAVMVVVPPGRGLRWRRFYVYPWNLRAPEPPRSGRRFHVLTG